MSQVMCGIATQNKIDKIVEVLKSIVNEDCSIAIAGAHAKGMADESSDIDLFMFTDSLKCFEERRQIIEAIADKDKSIWITPDGEEYPWGKSIDFSYQGTPIEVCVRTFAETKKSIDKGIEGKFDIIPQTWTSNGYYTFIHLCELSFIKPVWDAHGILQSYQESIAVYPPKLKDAIIASFMGRASTWINNFHYDSAIKRGDLLFTAPIVLHTVLDMIQVIFALNEVYFTGDKKLEKQLQEMKYCPQQLIDNLDTLLSAPRDTVLLQNQCNLIKTIYGELVAQTK